MDTRISQHALSVSVFSRNLMSQLRKLFSTNREMSILTYFTRTAAGQSAENIVLPSREESGVLSTEYDCIVKEVQNGPPAKRKRTTYREDEKMKIAKYANIYGTVSALRHFKQDFPKLTESTIRPWLAKYRSQLKTTSSEDSECIQISETRGRPLLLPNELDRKLRTFITSTRTAGGTINKHVIYGILMGLIKSDLRSYGRYLDFVISKGWLQSLYQRMNFTRRIVTTARPAITKAAWLELNAKFLHDIVSVTIEDEIPDELIINVDQTPSKFVPTENVTMAEKNSTHVSKKGASDKRGITVTFAETLSGQILPFQLIYAGKTSRSLPNVEFPAGFSLSYNEKHWSNEAETISLLNNVIYPQITKVKENLALPETQQTLLIWDAFKAQSTEKVMCELEKLNIKAVMVPKNMTHLLQPLDLTTNASVKKMEKRGFSAYFTSTITEALEKDPNRDVATIEVDLKLSTLKPIHAKVLMSIYEFLQGKEGRKIILNGWRAAGITDTIKSARETGCFSSLDPFEH